MLLLRFLQPAKIVLSRNACCFQIVSDNRDWNFTISRNHNGSGNTRFGVGAMASFLSGKPKASFQKYLF